MRKFFLLLTTGLALAACSSDRTHLAFESPAPGEPEAQIRFVQYGTVNNWHADNDRVLYVEDRGRQWYQVELFGPCLGLEYANTIRLIPSDGAGTFDRFGHIVSGDQRCQVESVKRIGDPLRTTAPLNGTSNADRY